MNIREYPLAWRWTNPKYAEFPPDILAQISPLDSERAATVHDRWFPYFDRNGEVISRQFVQIDTCPTEGTWKGDGCSRDAPLIGQVTEWLRTREPDIGLPVTVSWLRDCAVRTTWEIFTQWWDDFCYASSDDVFIVPDVPRWLLAFHHEDWFSFCLEPSV